MRVIIGIPILIACLLLSFVTYTEPEASNYDY